MLQVGPLLSIYLASIKRVSVYIDQSNGGNLMTHIAFFESSLTATVALRVFCTSFVVQPSPHTVLYSIASQHQGILFSVKQRIEQNHRNRNLSNKVNQSCQDKNMSPNKTLSRQNHQTCRGKDMLILLVLTDLA